MFFTSYVAVCTIFAVSTGMVEGKVTGIIANRNAVVDEIVCNIFPRSNLSYLSFLIIV